MGQVGSAPPAISTKPKVFQIKTPLRTIILKARHEVDAEVEHTPIAHFAAALKCTCIWTIGG